MSRRAFGALIVIQLFSAISIAIPPLVVLYVLALIIWFLIILIDLRLQRIDKDEDISFEIPAIVSLEREFVAVVKVERYRPGLSLEGIGTEAIEIVSNRANVVNGKIEFKLLARSLGKIEITKLELSWYSNYGFWKLFAKIELDRSRNIRVIPQQEPQTEQVLRELMALPSASVHARAQRSRARSGDIYYTSRLYQYGDELRHLDVRKSAKFGIPYVQTYERESELHVVLALDLGRGMRGVVRKSLKLDFYLSVAEALLCDAIANGDRVSIVGFSDYATTYLRKSSSLKAMQSALDRIANTGANGSESNYPAAARLIANVAGSRSLVVMLGDAARPGVRAGLLPTLELLSKRHIVSTLTLIEEEFDLENCLEKLESIDEAHLIHAYTVRAGWDLFSERVKRLGGAAALVTERYWLAAARLLYRDLRWRVHTA